MANSLSTSGGITKSSKRLPAADVKAVKAKLPMLRKGTMKKGK